MSAYHYPNKKINHKPLRVEIFKGKDDGWYWHVKAGNNKIVLISGEAYLTKWGCRRAARKFIGL